MKTATWLLIISTIIFSCNQASITKTEAPVKASVDSLISNWYNNWNKHDSAALKNMFLDNTVLVDDNLVMTKAGEVSEKWIHPNINVVSNLKSSKLQEWSEGNRAGYTGKYKLDVVIKDSVVAKPEGLYSVNWLKTEKGDWKITSAVIYSFKK